MSVDYGYQFSDSEVKAFISLEALEYYRDVYHANRVKLVTEDFEKMKSIVDEHLTHIAAALESHRRFIRLHQITEEERESLDYRFIEELHEAIYGEPMFRTEKIRVRSDLFLCTFSFTLSRKYDIIESYIERRIYHGSVSYRKIS